MCKRQIRIPILTPIFNIALLTLLTLPLLTLPEPASAQGRPPAKVQTAPVVLKEIQERVTLVGRVTPWRKSTVASEGEGKVDRVKVRRGDSVKGGITLALLDNKTVSIRLKSAQAKADAAGARYEKAKDRLLRGEQLIKKEAISEGEFKDIILSEAEERSTYEDALAGALLLEEELRKSTIRAPFSGVITEELTEVGQWLGRGDGVFEMVDLSSVRIVVDLPERYVSEVTVGAKVTVSIDAAGGRPFEGVVHALIPEGSHTGHIFPMEIRVQNDDRTIKGGMLARVDFPLGLKKAITLVPKDAVITRGNKRFILTVEDGSAREVIVETGKASGGLIAVEGDIKEGAAVITRGNERVRGGSKVMVINGGDGPEGGEKRQ